MTMNKVTLPPARQVLKTGYKTKDVQNIQEFNKIVLIKYNALSKPLCTN
jgi:hypothetical protein